MKHKVGDTVRVNDPLVGKITRQVGTKSWVQFDPTMNLSLAGQWYETALLYAHPNTKSAR